MAFHENLPVDFISDNNFLPLPSEVIGQGRFPRAGRSYDANGGNLQVASSILSRILSRLFLFFTLPLLPQILQTPCGACLWDLGNNRQSLL